MRTILLWMALALAALNGAAQERGAPVLVTLWFDTEDYILPQDDDAAKRIADLLTRLGVRATFKVVGEKARVLERRGRRDVIAALARHDIGYHSNTHSQQPTVAVYLQNAGWDDGRAEFYRRESQGARDVERIFGVKPSAYGQPGSAWAPQAYPALRDMGIDMYLDEADHVGLDDQPFYYGGMLNVFKMRSMVARMELNGGESLTEGQSRFNRAYEQLRSRGGGTISIYYHPNEWVHSEFWDAANFKRGANPARADWKVPAVRPVVETERAFRDFEEYVRFIKAQADVRFVTASELQHIYRDTAAARNFSPDDLLRIARAVQNAITYQRIGEEALSAADQFALLTSAMAAFVERNQLPAGTRIAALDGPARAYVPSAGGVHASSFPWEAFGRSIRDAADFARASHRIPDEVWVGAESLSPADYLATLARVLELVSSSGRAPAAVVRTEGRFTADRYVAADSPALWGWIIFPEGFHAPQIMELARLQAWTLKPAILHR